MATTPIKLKRSFTQSIIPDTSDLVAGEVALNTVDKKFYVRDGSSQVVTLVNHYATDFDVNVVSFKVTVATKDSSHPYHGVGSSNGYKLNGVFAPYLKLIPKNTYRFDQSDSSNSGHPFRFYLDVNKTTQYTSGVTVANGSGGPGTSGAYTELVIGDTTPPVLFYQCSAHGNMGWAATTGTRSLFGFDTDDLSEGSSNLYFTNARADARISNAIKDEDNMASNSATHVPSQQSVKAYVDATVEATNELVEDSSPQLGANLDLNSNNITGTGNISTTGNLTLTSTDAGSSAAPTIDLVRDSSSPADADYLGQLAFKGDDDGGSSHTYAKISGKIDDASAGSEDGLLEFAVVSGGSNEIVARIKNNGLFLNTGNTLRFEGATADAHETTLTVTDPTADRTITIPNNTGTLALTSDITGGGSAGSFTTLTSSGNTTIGNATSDSVTFNARVNSNFVPAADDTHSLGTASLKWSALHVSGSTIFLGNAELQASGTVVVLPQDSKIGTRKIPESDPNTGVVTRRVPLFTQAGGLSTAAKTFTMKAGGRSDRVFNDFTKEGNVSITAQERALFSF